MHERPLPHPAAELIFVLVLLAGCSRTGEPPASPPPPASSGVDAGASEGPDPLVEELQRNKRARADAGTQPLAEGLWRSCDVFNGRVTFCGGWHTGKVIAQRGGFYQECDAFNGRVASCSGAWFTGRAVVEQGGVLKECDVFSGRLGICQSWFTGKATLLRKQ